MNQTESPATGYIRVRVTNAGGNFPVEGAIVYISEYQTEEGRLLYSLRTNLSGLTPTVPVPALPMSESLTPSLEAPYALYNIRVIKDGYYTAEGVGVPVFEGIVSLQSFDLQPLTERDQMLGDANRLIYEVVDAPGLMGQGAGYPNEATGTHMQTNGSEEPGLQKPVEQEQSERPSLFQPPRRPQTISYGSPTSNFYGNPSAGQRGTGVRAENGASSAFEGGKRYE